MGKIKGEEPHVKARRTSLNKKTNEELINIILRKDKTERSNINKIELLSKCCDDLKKRTSVEYYNKLEKDYNTLTASHNALIETHNSSEEKLIEYEHTVDVLKDKINVYLENIDNINLKYNTLVKQYDAEIARLANKCNILQKSLWITVLIFVIVCGISIWF